MRTMTSRKRMMIGLGAALVAVLAVILYAAGVRAEADGERSAALERYGGEQTEVCVATRDIAPGETIRSSDVEMVTWPVSLLAEGSIVDPDKAVGSQTSSLIQKGEPVTETRLDGGDASLGVPDGLVAVSVPAKDVRAVGGALARGSLVDVYVQSGDTVSLLGENLLVLSTSQDDAGSSSGSQALSWVTLAVTPESVQELLAAAQQENLYFTLPGSSGSTAGDDGEAPGGVQGPTAEAGGGQDA